MKTIARLVLSMIAGLAAFAPTAAAQGASPHGSFAHAPGDGHDHGPVVRRTEPWSEAAKHAFAELPVCISGEKETRHGLCAGVDDDGALLLRTANGIERILAGDVSLRPLAEGGR